MKLTEEKIEDIVKGIGEGNKDKIDELYGFINPSRLMHTERDSFGPVEKCYYFNQCAKLKSILCEIKAIREKNSQ